jgi:hypothetical protein
MAFEVSKMIYRRENSSTLQENNNLKWLKLHQQNTGRGSQYFPGIKLLFKKKAREPEGSLALNSR